MKKLHFILVVCITLFCGCSTVPKPSVKNDTLIVGEIINHTNNKGKIKIQLLEKETGKQRIYLLKKGSLFFFDKLDGETSYLIEKIMVIKKNKEEQVFTNDNANFTIVGSKVNNIGVITLGKNGNFATIDRHILVINKFEEENGKSQWLKKKWENYLWNYLSIENNMTISKEELHWWIIFSSENKDIDFKVIGIDELNYSIIDEIEKINIREEELLEFIEEGHLIK
jgi:hypothetical protein